jgi:hypothetical protein
MGLLLKIKSKQVKIEVIGLGYALVIEFFKKGCKGIAR